MGILIDNRQSRLTTAQAKIQSKAQAVLSALDSPESELSILLVDDEQIAELNTEYLDREGPTNVIAFPMQEGEFSQVNPFLLGDVVISIETAERESRKAGIPLEERVDELLVHGILHLFGYDHENDENGAALMAEKTRVLMALITQMEEE